jgi:hypothetical protein
MEIVYTAPPTLARFHACDDFYRGIKGPVGSGKSTGCCMEAMRRSVQQKPGPDGLRRSRGIVIRNTYRELKDTTTKTWLDWFPEVHFGRFNWSDMSHEVRFNDVRLEVLFRALDRPQDVKKVLSLEATWAWFNEAREIPLSLVFAVGDRVGRYPAMRDGGCTWSGVWLDTNPPDDDHWWYRLAERERPEGWSFFSQPGGLLRLPDGSFAPNPAAENIAVLDGQGRLVKAGLPPDYYVKRMAGKSREHIEVYYCGQYGFTVDGRPVWPEYSDAIHCAAEEIEPLPGRAVCGLDFGLTPAAVLCQRLPNGRVIAFDELVSEDMGVQRFGRMLKPELAARYPRVAFDVAGDPAGEQRAQTDERTPFQILQAMGIPARPAPSNDFTVRREAVASLLSRLVDGKPALVVSPRCKVLRKALAGGYCFKRMQVSGQERYADRPDKNRFSHVADALQYAALGLGEGRALVRPEGHETAARQEFGDYAFRLNIDRAGAGMRQAFGD